jgi:uncharacterized membrane protein
MNSHQATPWIYHQSRLIISAIAALGLLETTYLSWVKLSGGVACPTTGCNEVLNSPYATVLGLPLTLFGCLAYGIMLILASVPLVVEGDNNSKIRQPSSLNIWTWRLMFAVAVAMVSCSAYLMYILFFQIQQWCPFCIASAIFSATLLILSIIGYPWEDWGQLGFNGLIVGMISCVVILGAYNSFNPALENSSTGAEYQITTTSGPAELALAQYLEKVGVKNYGAYWCPHCQEQKELLGQQAFAMIDYIECDPQGKNSQSQLCKAVGITGYPTWEIQGELYPGRLSLEQLADLSGYPGRRDFQS